MALTAVRPRYGTARAYVALTKPHIIELLLVTTVPAMVLAAHGMPSVWLIAVTLVGGFLAAGGANAINCYIDRDIDEIMARTRRRPLPQHVVSPRSALIFGVTLGCTSIAVFVLFVNILTALLAISALLFYVFVYTLWLKRSTPQNIVIGGAAGAVPPLIGWAAVTGQITLPAIILFTIIFFWTPPHFWALALRYKEEYAAARVPMLPVVRGEEETRRQIFLYSIVLVAVTMLLWLVQTVGIIYATAALGLGIWFSYQALCLWRDPQHRSPMRLFAYSITYLALLFLAMVVDQAAQNLLHTLLI
ncbi:MAG: heme o synthase [Dehalococcoidia bacterium]